MSTLLGTTTTTGTSYCPHALSYCGCNNGIGYGNTPSASTQCSICLTFYIPGTLHSCNNNLTLANGTATFTNWMIGPNFKEVKEITTDNELNYEWDGQSFEMKLPAKFSDCFLKVGYTWSPLYPLIFSAYENASKVMSFHLVIGIIDKIFEGDKVVLKSVTTTKIEDNLTLLQLTNRVRQYFEDR